MRIIELTERRASQVRLHPEDAHYLLREHAHHVRLMPLRERNRYRITPTHLVGHFRAPRSQVLIHPKLPPQALLNLLDPKAGEMHPAENVETVCGDSLLDWLARRFARLLEDRIRAGLHRDYVEHHEEGMRLRGRLDMPAQARNATTGRLTLHSQWEEMTSDIPCNQVPLAVLMNLLRSANLNSQTRQSLQHCLPAMESITPCEQDLDPDQQPEAYQPLLRLCHWLRHGLQPNAQIGEEVGPSFLLDLERLLESYVTREVIELLSNRSEYRVLAQPYLALAQSDDAASLMARPDLMIQRHGEPIVIMDVKWKHLRKSGPESSDLYQILAYCTAFGAKRGVLIYPGRKAVRRSYRVSDSGILLETRTIPVSGTAEACREEMRRIVESLC